MKLPSHIPSDLMIKLAHTSKSTFFRRVTLRGVDYIELFNADRLYSVKDWNRKNPDLQIKLVLA